MYLAVSLLLLLLLFLLLLLGSWWWWWWWLMSLLLLWFSLFPLFLPSLFGDWLLFIGCWLLRVFVGCWVLFLTFSVCYLIVFLSSFLWKKANLLTLVKERVNHIPTWLVVSTHFKNLLVKLDHFPNFRGENGQTYLKLSPTFTKFSMA